MICRFLLVGLIMAVMALTYPHRCNAGWESKDLPTSVRLVLVEVGKLMDKKEYGRAIDAITAFQSGDTAGKGETKDRTHPILCFALGNCYLLREDYTKAKKAYQEALKREPGYVEACLNLAKACYELRQYSEAARCYSDAYELSGRADPDYLFFGATGFTMAEDYSRAIASFERLFKEHSGKIQQQWRENFVHALIAADQPRRALPVIEEIVNQAGGDQQKKWQETLLQLYLQLNMTEKAFNCAKALTRYDWATARWWKALAHVQLSLGHYEGALASLTIYGYLTPLTAEERKLWADLNLQLDIPIKAAGIYETMLKDNPDKRLLQNLVTAYQRLDMNEKALALLERFRPSANDPELIILKGDLLYGLKRFNDAGNEYLRAAKINSGQAGRAWLLAGYASWRTNDLGASRTAFENAAKYDSQRKAALVALAELKGGQ